MNFQPRHRAPAYRLLAVVLFISALAHIPIVALILMLAPGEDVLDPTALRTNEDFTVQLVEDEPTPTESRIYVQLPRTEPEETPDKADFEARHAQKVERQTVSREKPSPLPVAAARPVPAQSPVKRTSEDRPTPEHIMPPAKDVEKPSKSEATQKPEETRPDDVGPTRKKEKSIDVPAPPSPDPSELFPKPSDAFAAQQSAAGGHDNHIPDVEEGQRTLLNRHRTKYWAFFDRIVNQVRDNWNGTDVYQRNDPDGSIHGVRDRSTTLRIALRSDGTIHNIWISSSSGLDHLDKEAIRAMRAAAPFYNPPDDLKDKDGLILFSFTFFIEIRSDDTRNMKIKWRP